MKRGKDSARVRLRVIRTLALLGWLLLLPWPWVARAQSSAPPKQVLILYWYNKDFPWNVAFDRSFQTTLQSAPEVNVETYSEYLESNRFPGESQSLILRDYLKQKYADRGIDVVVATSDASLDFLLKYRDDLFPQAPVVFVATRSPSKEKMPIGPGLTGITILNTHRENLDLALSLHPGTTQVFIISGTLERDKRFETLTRKELQGYESKVELVYLTDLSLEELIAKVKGLPERSIVLHVWQQSQNEQGKVLENSETLGPVARSATVPVYAMNFLTLFSQSEHSIGGSGVVGGVINTGEASGKRVAEFALMLAKGARASDIPIEPAPTQPMFDFRELRRRGIDEAKLPLGSIVRFKEPSVWELYKWRIVGALSLIVLQALGIVWLLLTQAKRRQAERKSNRFALLAESEHQHLDEIVANVPGIVWEAKLEAGDPVPKTTFVSPYLGKMLGYTVGEWLSKPAFWLSVIVEEDRERAKETVTRVLDCGADETAQFRYLTKDGRVLWAEAHLTAICDDDGKPVGLRGVTMNISDRRQAEEALRERKEQLSEAQRIAKIGSWEWDPTTDTVTWSEEMFHIMGREPTLPAPSYAEHPSFYTAASWQRLKSAVEKTLQDGTPYEIELEMIHADGSLVWTNARGEVLRDAAGTILKIRGTLQDIAERKRAEAALQTAMAEVSELKNKLEEENIYLQEEIKLAHDFDEIVGRSDATKYVLFKIEQVAPTNSTVLITGETGTGKELVARAIHSSSLRRDRPLVRINCAALSPTLIESELFGHEKGSFTGATARKIGRFELANDATIFLDEIGELPLELQAKLLRVIQESEFERLGSSKTIKVDARIIAATNRNLKIAVEEGTFREDLWYRLNVFPITVPPLRDRKEDIPSLVEHFVRKFAQRIGRTISSIPPVSMRLLQGYSWPGNVRELANVLERAVINSTGTVLRVADHFEKAPIELSQPDKTLEEMEKEYIIRILETTGWRIEGHRGAAGILGLNPSTLRTRMAKLGIQKLEARTVTSNVG